MKRPMDRLPRRLNERKLNAARTIDASKGSRTHTSAPRHLNRWTMAKSKPITLPNGRTWLKKGDAVEHFKRILGRYAVGRRVHDEADHDDLYALLKVYDAVVPQGKPTKAGTAGVAHFEKRLDIEHPGHTTCFYVVRKDGSSIDFSYRRALDAAGEQAQ